MAELFAGAGCLANVFDEAGARVAAADVCYGPGMDICMSSGFGSFSQLSLTCSPSDAN